MDDGFFASVLKRWAESSQEVVDLKKRLGEVEQERNGFRREMGLLKAKEEAQKQVKSEPLASPICSEVEILDLDEVQDKLEKARFEYQRRLKELHDTRSREVTLKRHIEQLKHERTQLQSQVQSSKTQYAEASSELTSLRFEKTTMIKEISNLKLRLEQAEKAQIERETIRTPHTHGMDTQQVTKLQEQMTSLEMQLWELQMLAQTLETENATLRRDLEATRGSLQKTKESNKGLRTTIGQLSRIARNVASTHPESTSVRSSVEVPRASSPEVAKPEPASKQEPKANTDLSFNDVTIVAEPDDPLAPISVQRLEALASLPVIIPDTDINDEDNKFTRGFTSAAIRGSVQSLIVQYAKFIPGIKRNVLDDLIRVTSSGTDLAKCWNIEEYLCPRLDHNPWCPSIPGQHGYMFVGLGRERHTYTTPQLRNLFVGLPKRSHKDERYFRYLGVYRVSRVDPLNVAEWTSLHNTVKQNYVQATKHKNKDPRTKEAILAAYDSGELFVACVKLECVDFDEELYAGLLGFRAKHSSTQQSRSSKRTRADDEHESDSQAQRSKRSAGKRVAQ